MNAPAWLYDPLVLACVVIFCVTAGALAILIAAFGHLKGAKPSSNGAASRPVARAGRHRSKSSSQGVPRAALFGEPEQLRERAAGFTGGIAQRAEAVSMTILSVWCRRPGG
jgi:hypothetical protein